MGLYTSSIEESGILDDEDFDYDALDEACAVAFLSRQPDEIIQEFAKSAECEALITEGKISKKTIMRLNKNNDLTRRQTLAAYQEAKRRNDPLWLKFIKAKAAANKLKREILRKYGKKAEMIAKKSQRNFVSNKGTEATVKTGIQMTRRREIDAGRPGAA